MKKRTKTKGKYAKERRNKNQEKNNSPQTSENKEPTVDDGYDGYYDDILPPDIGQAKEGLDKELIKKVIFVGVVVFVVISLCVVLLYVL